MNSTVARGRSEPAMSRRETTSAVCVRPAKFHIAEQRAAVPRCVCVDTRRRAKVCVHAPAHRLASSILTRVRRPCRGTRVQGREGRVGGDTRGGRTPPYPASKQGRLLAGPRRGTARGDRPVSGARRDGGYRLSRLCSGEKTRGVRWSASPAKTQNPATCRGACTKLTMNR